MLASVSEISPDWPLDFHARIYGLTSLHQGFDGEGVGAKVLVSRLGLQMVY